MFTSFILYINTICIAQWLSGGNSEILHGYDVFARRQILCKPESIFQANTCQLFLPRKYDVISQLRHSYAKGPFCVARLKKLLIALKNLNASWQIFFQSFEFGGRIRQLAFKILKENHCQKSLAISFHRWRIFASDKLSNFELQLYFNSFGSQKKERHWIKFVVSF